MRKKALIEQNLSLFKQIEELRGECALKDKKINELEKKISAQAAKPAPEAIKPDTPLKKLEDKVTGASKLNPDVEYASEAIGKLVLESAIGSNTLTAGGNTEHRELVNLLLGKTEVAKAEILGVLSEDIGIDGKKAKIDTLRDEALDYFASVLAQVS